MSKLNLKSILKKNETASLLASFTEAIGVDICIKDDTGKVLFGTEPAESNSEHPVVADGEQIGVVQGGEKVNIIANLLNLISQKEAEKKKLGTEVLTLYQEINLVFNFSEKLAQTIDAPSICAIALEELKHVIKADHGVVILWEQDKEKVTGG
ncbi:MAG TPA: hypothetical protein VM368_05340 [Flavisolibacter sp.]|nr:hypothetical protein [Flavisolibacter sp.]